VKLVVAVLLATLFGLQIPEKKPASLYRAESSAYVIHGKDAWTYVTENRSFRFEETLKDDGSGYEAELLLEESYRNEHRDGSDEVKGMATIKAWTIEPNRPRELRWTIQEVGNAGTIQDRFFRITAWGCCDAPTVHSYYNLLTGKKVYKSNADLLEVTGDEGGPQDVRYVGFGYPALNKLSEPPQLQYGTDKGIIQRFSVLSSRKYFDAPQVFVSTNEKLEKSLDLRGSPMNFAIVLKYNDGVVLRVPVEGNAVRSEKAVLPDGYSLRVEK
jgi:hypothetical protein